MQINENTLLIGRFHKKVSPRSLNIYNPVFEELGINAVYMLFYNEDPAVLVSGLRTLKLSGAIVPGFESDSSLPPLLDSLSNVANFVGKVGFMYQRDGIVTGDLQSGKGILRTIEKVSSLEGKRLVIVGAGNVVKALLFEIREKGISCDVSIFNRTLGNAEALQEEFPFIKARTLDELGSANGDILANISDIGGSAEDIYFTEKVVGNFSNIVDITFERENTNLVELARKLGKNISTGWDMFAYQGIVCLEAITGVEIPFDVMRKHVHAGLSETVV